MLTIISCRDVGIQSPKLDVKFSTDFSTIQLTPSGVIPQQLKSFLHYTSLLKSRLFSCKLWEFHIRTTCLALIYVTNCVSACHT